MFPGYSHDGRRRSESVEVEGHRRQHVRRRTTTTGWPPTCRVGATEQTLEERSAYTVELHVRPETLRDISSSSTHRRGSSSIAIERVRGSDQTRGTNVIKSWLFEFFHQPLDEQRRSDPQAVNDHFHWYLDLWTRADSRNFEGIFFSEHHFGAAYSPSPNLLISHVAARTDAAAARRARFGQSVRDAVARGRGDRDARSPHQRSVGDRRRQRDPARAGGRRHHPRRRSRSPRRGHRRARRGAEEPGDLAPRHAVELRRPRDPAALPAAAVSAGVDGGAHRGIRRTCRPARVEGVRRIPVGQGDRRGVRRVPSGRRGGRAPARSRADRRATHDHVRRRRRRSNARQ